MEEQEVCFSESDVARACYRQLAGGGYVVRVYDKATNEVLVHVTSLSLGSAVAAASNAYGKKVLDAHTPD